MSTAKNKRTKDDTGGTGQLDQSARYSRLNKAGDGGTALWTMVEPALLARAVGLVIAVGDAITFSQTRDGGAGCICILTDGQQVKVYGSNPDELADLLTIICDGCQEAVMRAVV